jgi:hypothetical protein
VGSCDGLARIRPLFHSFQATDFKVAHYRPTDTEGTLNEYGAMGWEAVTVWREYDRCFILFKQPISK